MCMVMHTVVRKNKVDKTYFKKKMILKAFNVQNTTTSLELAVTTAPLVYILNVCPLTYICTQCTL